MKPARAIAVLLTLALWVVACSDDEGSADEVSTTSSSSTSTTLPPVILALTPNLGLSPGQCFAEVPLADAPTSTVPTGNGPDDDTTPVDDRAATDDTGPTTVVTTPDTLATTTTLPRPPVIAVVDCAGSSLGEVYAAFCLGQSEDERQVLTAVACPGDPELDYPGDRTIRRAAARACLQRFEELFGEEYGASPRVAQEFTPTEGVWVLGDHRVVCHTTDRP